MGIKRRGPRSKRGSRSRARAERGQVPDGDQVRERIRRRPAERVERRNRDQDVGREREEHKDADVRVVVDPYGGAEVMDEEEDKRAVVDPYGGGAQLASKKKRRKGRKLESPENAKELETQKEICVPIDTAKRKRRVLETRGSHKLDDRSDKREGRERDERERDRERSENVVRERPDGHRTPAKVSEKASKRPRLEREREPEVVHQETDASELKTPVVDGLSRKEKRKRESSVAQEAISERKVSAASAKRRPRKASDSPAEPAKSPLVQRALAASAKRKPRTVADSKPTEPVRKSPCVERKETVVVPAERAWRRPQEQPASSAVRGVRLAARKSSNTGRGSSSNSDGSSDSSTSSEEGQRQTSSSSSSQSEPES